LAEKVNGAKEGLEKKYLTTPQIRDMIASTELMFYSYGARAAARAQKETFLWMASFPCVQPSGRFPLILIEGGVSFRFMLAPYA
jgi:hypothetical protein